MPSFEYEALSTDGQRSSGTLDAGAIGLAADALQRRGLEVIRLAQDTDVPIKLPAASKTIGAPISDLDLQRLDAQYVAPSIEAYIPLPSSLVEQAFFFKQLHNFLRAGVPLVSAMDSLARMRQSQELRKAIRQMQKNAMSGEPLGDALAVFPKTFTPLIIAVIRAGEQGGFLPDAANSISEYLDEELEVRRLYRQLTLTPKLYTLAAAVVNFYFAYRLFTNIWIPVLTVWLILKVFQHDAKFQAMRDQAVLAIPVIGTISHEYAEAKFARAFGLLFENGVNVATGVEYAADACGNRTIRNALYPAGERLRSGVPIYTALRETGVLSNKFNDLLTTGSETGEIKSMLFQISEEFAAEAKHRSVQLAWYLSAAFFLAFCLVWAGALLTPDAARTSLPIPQPNKTITPQAESQPNNP